MKAEFVISALLLVSFLPMAAVPGYWALCRVAEVPIEQVRFFSGPTICSFLFRGTRIEIGLIPIGNYIKTEPCEFKKRGPGFALAVTLIGPVFTLLVAVGALGVVEAFRQFASGFCQLYLGALHPAANAQAMFLRLQGEFSASTTAVVGIIAAKLTAFELLPVGGPTFLKMMTLLFGLSWENRTVKVISVLVYAVANIIFLLWALALLIYALK